MNLENFESQFQNNLVFRKSTFTEIIITNTSSILTIISCLILFWAFGTAFYWKYIDTADLYIENPESPGLAITPVVKPGGYVIVKRSLKRTSDCHQTATNWLVSRYNALVYTLSYQEFFGKVTGGFTDGYVMYRIPVSFPNGIYKIRPYISCENNKLYTSNQNLSDIMITISDAASDNRDFITRFFSEDNKKDFQSFVAP